MARVYGVAVRVYSSFDSLVEALSRARGLRLLYVETLPSIPRTAFALGELGGAAASMLAVEGEDHVVLKLLVYSLGEEGRGAAEKVAVLLDEVASLLGASIEVAAVAEGPRGLEELRAAG